MHSIAQSIRLELLRLAHGTHRPGEELIQLYAIERFLYRLSISPYADRLFLKGALMLQVWNLPQQRPTRDIDLLGRLDNSPTFISQICRDICAIDCPDDGMAYDAHTLVVKPIQAHHDYQGVRAKFLGLLDRSKAHMQIDFGFSDQIYPSPITIHYPTILEMPSPCLRGYTPETTIAEKVEATIRFQHTEIRIKDLFDIWLLSRQLSFQGPRFASALHQTFRRRATPFSPHSQLIDPVVGHRQTKWARFRDQNRLMIAPLSLIEACKEIDNFILPPLASLKSPQSFAYDWQPGGPWR